MGLVVGVSRIAGIDHVVGAAHSVGPGSSSGLSRITTAHLAAVVGVFVKRGRALAMIFGVAVPSTSCLCA